MDIASNRRCGGSAARKNFRTPRWREQQDGLATLLKGAGELRCSIRALSNSLCPMGMRERLKLVARVEWMSSAQPSLLQEFEEWP